MPRKIEEKEAPKQEQEAPKQDKPVPAFSPEEVTVVFVLGNIMFVYHVEFVSSYFFYYKKVDLDLARVQTVKS
jgi:hypothetical protein